MKTSFENLNTWFTFCYEQLERELEDTESFALLDSFSGEFRLKALRLYEEGRSKWYFYYQLLYESIRAQIPVKVKKSHCLDIVPQKNQRLDILFWPWQIIHWEYLKPIRDRAQLENLEVSVTSNNDIVRSVFGENEQVESSLIRLNRISFLRDSSVKLILERTHSLPSFKAKNGKELTFFHLVIEVLRNHFQLYHETLQSYQNLKRNYNPRALFLGNPSTLVGAAVWHRAKKDGVRVFSIMHGALNSSARYDRSHFFFVFGSKDLEYLESNHSKESKVIVSGSPKLDGLKKRSTNSKKDHILVAFSGPGHSVSYENHIESIKVLEAVVRSFPREEFVVKLHKKDKKEYYSDLSIYQNVTILDSHEQGEKSDVFEWLITSKVLITGASTSALDAMNMNVPVLSINIGESLNHFPMIEQGIILSTNQPEQIIDVLGKLISDSDYLDQYLEPVGQFIEGYYADRDAGQTVIKHLKDQLN